MPKRIISFLLSSMFLLFLVAPTIIMVIDDSVDISTFYESSEEEEKGSEKNKEIELLSFELNTIDLDFTSSEVDNNSGYYFKKYAKPQLNLILPPPEFYEL